jgi:hypothetical protein
MKVAIILSAAALAIGSAAAIADDGSTTGRGAGAKSVGPASENGDTTTGNVKDPSTMGRSADPGYAPSATTGPRGAAGTPSPEAPGGRSNR